MISLSTDYNLTITQLGPHYPCNMTSLSPINDLSITKAVIPPPIPHNDQLNGLHSDTRMTARAHWSSTTPLNIPADCLRTTSTLTMIVLALTVFFLLQVLLFFFFDDLSYRTTVLGISILLQLAIAIFLLPLYSIEVFPPLDIFLRNNIDEWLEDISEWWEKRRKRFIWPLLSI